MQNKASFLKSQRVGSSNISLGKDPRNLARLFDITFTEIIGLVSGVGNCVGAVFMFLLMVIQVVV